MKIMSREKYIDKLLQNLKIEWTTLGNANYIELADKKRKAVKSSNRIEGNIPYYGANNIQDYVDDYTHDGTYVLVAEDGTTSVERYSIQWATGKFWANNHVHVLRAIDGLDNRFLFHYLHIVNFVPFLTGGGRAKLTKAKLLEIPIPIPYPDDIEKSLAIQRRIVDILDKFTELEAELEGRKRQYEYYRNKLLSIDVLSKGKLKTDKIRIMTLGELGTFTRGSGLQKKDFTPTGVGCIHYGQIYTHYGTWTDITKTCVSKEFARKLRKAKYGNLIIATTSENDEDVCKAVAWLGKEDIAISSDACFYAHTIDPKYVAYYFQTRQFQKQKRKFITGTKVRRVNTNDLAKIQIPIPPLSEQQRIVSILDKFDTLTTSISEGLPKEIELRRKQYEYYRDRLLSFKH
ncbi:restriction endonuclease subunit S [Prevotella histicola]|jgi:type I restriction/modification specificity protein|uniref:restriction endonuclease subunit S n=1 Tax=Prevotella histicola TaxID=470565 RepID=UPI00241C2D55|nr:restriction endonuclease subunit S [Prevotella histicola]